MNKLPGRSFLLVFLLVCAVAIIGVGCGGGDDETTTTTTQAATETEGPTVSTPEADPVSRLLGSQLIPTERTPGDVKASLEGQKPMAILFYVAGCADDDSVLRSLNSLKNKHSDVDFYIYDYRLPDTFGDLSTKLNVLYTPHLVLIDARGAISQVSTGYVDEGTLNQYLVNLERS